jgi:hypothetical protein
METLIILGFVFFATMSVFGFIDVMRQINRIPDEPLETKKISPCVGHELESQKEEKRLSKKRVGRRN